MTTSADTWREATEAEREALRPFTIDAVGLTPGACAELRELFAATYDHFWNVVAAELGRSLNGGEEASLAAAIVSWLNRDQVPLHRQRERGLN